MQHSSTPSPLTNPPPVQLGGIPPGVSLGIPHAAPPGLPASSVGISPAAIRIPMPVGLGSARPSPLGGAAALGAQLGHTALLGVSGMTGAVHAAHGLTSAGQYAHLPPRNYTALSPQQMVHLVEKRQQQQHALVAASSSTVSISSPSGAYSMSISRSPLVVNNSPHTPLPPHGGAISIPSPRTPSVHSPGTTISRPVSRPASRSLSAASRPGSALPQGSPAGLPLNSMTSPRGIPYSHQAVPTPVAGATVLSTGQVSRRSAEEAPLDLTKCTKPVSAPRSHRPEVSSRTTSGEEALDLSSSNRKRKNDDSDDDIICTGVSMPPKVPRVAQTPLAGLVAPGTVGAPYITPPQVYQVHHAQAVMSHREQSQTLTPQQARSATPALGRHGVTSQGQIQGQGHQRSGSLAPSRQYPSPARPPSQTGTQGQSILEMYLEHYKAGRKFPERPTTPVSAQASHRPPSRPPGGAASAALKQPQLPAQQLLRLGQTALQIQMQKRQQLLEKQAAQQWAPPASTSTQGSAAAKSQLPAGGSSSLVHKGMVPGLPDTNPVRQANMLKQHPELHSLQIQGGRMMNHSVVQRPGVVVDNKSQGATSAGAAHAQHKISGKERITYMMASEPVPACATTSATAIQITQQPTYIGAPLMVPNPAGKMLSRFSAGLPLTAATTTTTATANTCRDVPPGVVKTEIQESPNTQQTTSAQYFSSVPQKHFMNSDTQTADLPGEQWHRPPFHRMGMPHKNIPVANVNPMVHTKCASPALHPKKQILFQSQSGNQGQVETQGHGEGQSRDVKPEVSTGPEVMDSTRLSQDGAVSVKPEFSSSHDIVKSEGHEQYLSKIKERLIRKVSHSGEDGVEGKVRQDSKGLKQLKRKYRTGKYTGPLMKKAAQAMKRELVTSYHHSNQVQQQHGSPGGSTHSGLGRPVLSKTVLDLSDITGESMDDSHSAHARSLHKRHGHQGAMGLGRKLGMKERMKLKKEKVKEEKKCVDEEGYDGETEIEDNSNDDTEVEDSESDDYKPPKLSRAERVQARQARRQSHARVVRNFVQSRGKTGRKRHNSFYHKNAAYERELRKDEYRKLLIRYRRKSRSTRSGNRSNTRRRLRALAEIPNYNDYTDDDDEEEEEDLDLGRDPVELDLDPRCHRDVEDAEFSPAGRGRGARTPLVRRRFLPKGKRTFFRGKHDGWGSLHNKRRRWKRRGDEDSDGSMSRTSSKYNDDSRDGFDSRPVPTDMRKLVVCKETGETVLHKAARLGHEEVVRYILETKSIDANARDNAGYTPVHESCVRGHQRVARLLISHGADVNAAALDGTRPIHDAVDNNHVELARLMLACGADMRIATYSGRTCVKLARSLEMQNLINGYMRDLNAHDDAIPWEFYGSPCTDASNKDSGCDIFANVPSDDETGPEGEIPDCDVMFEFSDIPLLPVYSITLKENEGPRHYYLLKSVLQRLHMGKKELLRHFPDLYICNISSISSQVKDMRPTLHKLLQHDKCFDIVKVTDTLDAALGYTREFLFPEHAHSKLIDLPDSTASRSRVHPPDSAAGLKKMKNGENIVRVKRKYTKRNKDAQNLSKKAATSDSSMPQGKSSPKVKKVKSTPGSEAVKKIGKCKKNLDSNKAASAPTPVTPSGSNSDTTPSSGGGDKEPEQDGGSELPVLEKHHHVTLDGAESRTEAPPCGEPGNEDPEMPELTIAAF